MIPGAAFVPGTTKPAAMARVHSAIRLGGLLLALATVMALTKFALPLAIIFLGIVLRWTGMGVSQQIQMIKPWWPMAVIILGVHSVTGCMSAGQLVVDGVVSGLVTLCRIMLCLGLLSLFLRVTSLDETIAAVHFWFKPLQIFGVQTRHLGLVLAVALGTAPVVLEEGKRIRAVVRMRRAVVNSTGFGGRVSRWRDSLLEWGHIVLPMMESLGRRADTLSLSLASRMPADDSGNQHGHGPGVVSLMVLTVWLLALLWMTFFPMIRG